MLLALAVHKISFSNRFVQRKRSFSSISIALKQDLLYHRLLRNSLVKLFLSMYVSFTMDNSIRLCISYAIRHQYARFMSHDHGIPVLL
jgi:hypothetical protein